MVFLRFFVKNQLSTQIPTQFAGRFEVHLVESDDDDDYAALVDALNRDCCILAQDKYQEYLKSGLVSKEWLDIQPTIPLSLIERR